MARPVRILAFGDNVVDCYRETGLMYPGGNCVNHAVFARRAGAWTAYAGAVGDDPAGDLIREALTQEGVDVSLLRTETGGATAYCVIETDGGERSFVGANLGVSIIAPSVADLERLASVDAIHTGRSSHVDIWLPRFQRATRVSYDLATVHDPERVTAVAPHCFLLSLSGGGMTREEAADLAGLARSAGATWCLVTRGSAGACLMGEPGIFWATAEPVEPIDTLGAGDTFIANVLVGLLKAEAPETALAAAAHAAAQTCLARGAFEHAAPLEVDLSAMMSIEEVYRGTRLVSVPADAQR